MKFVQQFSGRRDPVTTALNERAVGDSDTAVAAQLGLVCGDAAATRGQRRFNHLGEVGDYLTH